jgi:hypothetical protein
MKSNTVAVGSTILICAALGLSSAAFAKIQVVDFSIAGGGWFGGTAPYGLPSQPTLTGSVTVDDTLSGNAAFVGLDYKTGTRTWTLGDIISGGFGNDGVSYDALGVVNNITLEMGALGNETYVISNNTAGINFPLAGVDKSGAGIACNGCVSITSVSNGVPEPATWAMMLVGFGGLGAVMRSRRKTATAAA